MKLFMCFCFFCNCTITVQAQNIFDKDNTKPEAKEIWIPILKIVTPVKYTVYSDSIILFNGKTLYDWVISKDGQSSRWKLNEGIMIAKLGSGNIKTKQKFGDCQLHIEFMLPPDFKRYGHDNADNSGEFITERYKIQIINSYNV